MRYYNRFTWEMDHLPGIAIWGALWIVLPVLLFLTIKALREKVADEINASYGMEDASLFGYTAFEMQTNLAICFNILLATERVKSPNIAIGIVFATALATGISTGVTAFIKALFSGNETLGHFLAVAVCWLKILAVATAITILLSSDRGRAVSGHIPVTTLFYNGMALVCMAAVFCKIIAERHLRLHGAALLLWTGVIFPIFHHQGKTLEDALILGGLTALVPVFAVALWLHKYRDLMNAFIDGDYDDQHRNMFCLIFVVYGGLPLVLHLPVHIMAALPTPLQGDMRLPLTAAGLLLLSITFAPAMGRYFIYAAGRHARRRRLVRVLRTPFCKIAASEFTLNEDDEISSLSSRLTQRLIRGNDMNTAAHIYTLLSPSACDAGLNRLLINGMLTGMRTGMPTANSGHSGFSRQLKKRLAHDHYHLFFEPFLNNPPANQHRQRIQYLFFDGDPVGLVMPRKREDMAKWFRQMDAFREGMSREYSAVMERFLKISSHAHMPSPHVIIPADRIVRIFRQGFFTDDAEALLQACLAAPVHRKEKREILLQAFFCLPFHERTAEYLLSMEGPAHGHTFYEHVARDWFFHCIRTPKIYIPSSHDETGVIIDFLFQNGPAPETISIRLEPLIQVLNQHPSRFRQDVMGRLMNIATPLDADAVMREHKHLTPPSAEKLLALAAGASWCEELVQRLEHNLREPRIFKHFTIHYNNGMSAAATWHLALIQHRHNLPLPCRSAGGAE